MFSVNDGLNDNIVIYVLIPQVQMNVNYLWLKQTKSKILEEPSSQVRTTDLRLGLCVFIVIWMASEHM